MLKKWLLPLSVTEKLVAFIIVLLLMGSMLKSAYYTLQNGGCDLRARVVGARLLGTSNSPYFYKWKPGDSERLLDPNDKPERLVNGVSSAPGALYIQALLNDMDYPAIRLTWMIIQYLLVAYIFVFFLRAKDVPYKRKLAAAGLGILFFLCTSIWFYHIERGQIYILFAFFFCLLLQLYALQKPWAHFLAGLVLILAVFCRPTFAVVGVPFLMVRNRWLLTGLVAGTLPLSVHFLLNRELWLDYQHAMNIYTGFRVGSPTAAHDYSSAFPSSIEGASNLGNIKTDFVAGGVVPLAEHIRHYLPHHLGYIYIVIYAGAVLLLGILFRKNVRSSDSSSILLFGFGLYILAEYLMPAPRAPYNLVQWIVPVLVLLQCNRMSLSGIVLLVTGLSLTTGFPFTLPYSRDMGELLLVFCLFQFLWNTKVTSPIAIQT